MYIVNNVKMTEEEMKLKYKEVLTEAFFMGAFIQHTIQNNGMTLFIKKVEEQE